MLGGLRQVCVTFSLPMARQAGKSHTEQYRYPDGRWFHVFMLLRIFRPIVVQHSRYVLGTLSD
jgi:hypothetical protein